MERGNDAPVNTKRQTRGGEKLYLRAAVLGAIRQFFRARDYLEVDTPVRIPAPAPEAHIDAVASGDWFLQTSPELCMKRLLAAGLPRIYQICKCFRRGERGDRHLPEMTMLEWYTAGHDYQHMMAQCQELIIAVAEQLKLMPDLAFRGRKINLTPPWQRLSVEEAFARYTDTDTAGALADNRFDELMGLVIEPHLGWDRPLFLYDYPVECGALARIKKGARPVAERFELYIGGIELCNAFSELTDPLEQRRRFEAEMAQRQGRGQVVYPLPESFLEVLAHMPAAAGNALGIDRLVMVLTDAECIDEVVAFTPELL